MSDPLGNIVFNDFSPEKRAEQKAKKTPLSGIFESQPVPLDEFVTGRDYLNNPPLSQVQYEAVRHLEQIYLPETYDVMAEVYGDYWRPARFVNFCVCQWGKGSGKDHICRIAVARWIYLLMCLESPQAYFGMPAQETIHVLNVASSATQASRVFFTPFRRMVMAAPCFQGTFETMQGNEPGKYSIEFPGKNLECVSGHSGSEAQEGMNLIGGIADEISAFKTEAEAVQSARQSGREPSKTAESIVKMMRSSARTRFPRNFKLALISYPRYVGDAIQQYTQRAVDDNEKYGVVDPVVESHSRSKWFVSGPLATWEVNPRVTGKADFEDDYESDQADAEAKYECRPGKATNRFFRNTVALAESFAEERTEPLRVSYYWGRSEEPDLEGPIAPQEKDGWQVRFDFAGMYPMRGSTYALHADMSLNGDRAGIAMAHVQNFERAEHTTAFSEQIFEPRPIVKVDFVTAFEADLSELPEPREVQLRWFRKLVWVLAARGFYIGSVTMDGWQSLDSLQILAARGIEAKRLSCDVPQTPVWGTLKDVMYDGRLKGYRHPLLVLELASLMKLPNGKLDHPSGGSKDLADALAGAVNGSVEVGGSEGDNPERADQGYVEVFQTVGWGSTSNGGSMMPAGLKSPAMMRPDLSPP